jgi:hypothetical protein
MRLTSLVVIISLLLSSCGRFEKKTAPEVNPGEQQLKVGFESVYVLDRTRSDNILSSSELKIKVVAIDKTKTSFALRGKANTDFGSQNISIDRSVSNEVLQKGFMDKLRQEKSFKDSEFSIDYLRRSGICDLVRIYNIKGYDWIQVNATICTSKKNIPQIQANFKLYGQSVNATYLLKN